ncbi:MAG: putative ABC transporter permease [Clostridia bacterium]|nr:putative ABC transporter permease [Clostridia bacterium]
MAEEVAAQQAPIYDELAQCSRETGVPEELRQQIEGEAASLHRASDNFRTAHVKTLELQDELSARLFDVEKSLKKRVFRRNPPSNTAIDWEERQRQHFARGINLYKIGLILFVGSFAGVVVELFWCLITNGYLESRAGVVYGPFNILYGVGAAVLSLALYGVRNRGRAVSFLGGMLIGSAVEYVCSWLQELVLGTRSWDYSHMPFNLNGRICLLYSTFWGILGVLWIKDIYPRMSQWILHLPNTAGKILTWALVAFLAFDGLISALAVARWSARAGGDVADSAWEVFMDERFPDERMERIYANMSFVE